MKKKRIKKKRIKKKRSKVYKLVGCPKCGKLQITQQDLNKNLNCRLCKKTTSDITTLFKSKDFKEVQIYMYKHMEEQMVKTRR